MKRALSCTLTLLAATLAEPLEARQAASLLEEPVRDLAGLIDTLVNRVGAGAVYRLVSVPSDVPERSVRRIPALAEDAGDGWPGHWPRPARLHAVSDRYTKEIDAVKLHILTLMRHSGRRGGI